MSYQIFLQTFCMAVLSSYKKAGKYPGVRGLHSKKIMLPLLYVWCQTWMPICLFGPQTSLCFPPLALTKVSLSNRADLVQLLKDLYLLLLVTKPYLILLLLWTSISVLANLADHTAFLQIQKGSGLTFGVKSVYTALIKIYLQLE